MNKEPIESATKLLKENLQTVARVSEWAALIGYKNPKLFSRHFLRHFKPVAKDEDDINYLKGYDSDLQVRKLSSTTPPKNPVLVLGVNERTKNNKNSGNDGDTFINDLDPGGGGGGGGGSEREYREEGTLDVVTHLEVDNLGSYEPWHRGKADMWMQVDYSQGSPAEDKKWQVKRSKIKDGYNPYIQVRNWYTD